MSTETTTLPTVAQADLRRVASTAKRAAKAKTDLREAIVTARESGESHRDIAKAAGVSHVRIIQILREES